MWFLRVLQEGQGDSAPPPDLWRHPHLHSLPHFSSWGSESHDEQEVTTVHTFVSLRRPDRERGALRMIPVCVQRILNKRLSGETTSGRNLVLRSHVSTFVRIQKSQTHPSFLCKVMIKKVVLNKDKKRWFEIGVLVYMFSECQSYWEQHTFCACNNKKNLRFLSSDF